MLYLFFIRMLRLKPSFALSSVRAYDLFWIYESQTKSGIAFKSIYVLERDSQSSSIIFNHSTSLYDPKWMTQVWCQPAVASLCQYLCSQLADPTKPLTPPSLPSYSHFTGSEWYALKFA